MIKHSRENCKDEDLIAAVRSLNNANSDSAIKHIYKTNYSSVKNHILKNSGTEMDAADIFQDTIVVWYNAVRSGDFKGDSSIKTFLFAVSKNLWLKELRKKSKNFNIKESEGYESHQIPEPLKNSIDHYRILKETMNKLSQECKNLLIDFYFNKHSMNKIMTTFGLSSEQVAKNKKYKCMQNLMKIFKVKGITKNQIFE